MHTCTHARMGCSKGSKPHPDFRFFTHLSPLNKSHLHKN